MDTWRQYYDRKKNNQNENLQSLWKKYNDMVYSPKLVAGLGGGGGGNLINNPTIDTGSLYVQDNYVDSVYVV